MDGQTLRRKKLAKAAADAIHQRQNRRWGVLRDRIADVWGRFWAFSLWEKGLVLGGSALVVLIAPVAVLALVRGGDDGRVQVSAPVASATATAREVQPTATAVPLVVEPTATPVLVGPTATRTGVEASPTTKRPPDRTDCQEIRDTAYRSPAEREWFLANCLEPTLVDTAPPAEAVPPSQPDSDIDEPASPPSAIPEGPAPSPTPGTVLSAAAVIDVAVWWMSGEAPLGYTVSAGSCSASRTANLQWVVTCQAELPGCQSAACQTTLTAFVMEEPLTVWSC